MKGLICLWSGAIADIPTGWALCDGTNGTPDLRNRFIVGAGDTYAPDDTGGAANHNHPFTGVGHLHSIAAGPGMSSGADYQNFTAQANASGTTDNADSRPPYYALCFIIKT